jgi:hypothetical protein
MTEQQLPAWNVTVTSASRRNPQGVLPALAHVDVIRGAVRGPVADRDTWKAPDTRVVRTEDVFGREGTCTLRVPLTAGEESFYVRQRRQPQRPGLPRRLGRPARAGPAPARER